LSRLQAATGLVHDASAVPQLSGTAVALVVAGGPWRGATRLAVTTATRAALGVGGAALFHSMAARPAIARSRTVLTALLLALTRPAERRARRLARTVDAALAGGTAGAATARAFRDLRPTGRAVARDRVRARPGRCIAYPWACLTLARHPATDRRADAARRSRADVAGRGTGPIAADPL